MEERVRIADIAEELGLSSATVSNVIHGKTKKISDETVKRVQELLEKRQYIPSMAALLLSQNNSRIIGVVANDHAKYEGKVLEDGFISASLNALLPELEKAGYFMMVKVTSDREEVIRFASMWNMDGLVLLGFCETDYEKLREKMHIPFVVYDGFLERNDRICNLKLDDYDGGRQVGEYLYQMGHRRALLISDNDICMDRERMQGFRQGFRDGKADLWQVPFSREERRQLYVQKLEALRGYSAAFAVSDIYAVELIHFLQEHGMSVPDDISVVGYDNSFLCENCYPRLTTVGQDAKVRARAAVRALRGLREGTCEECMQILPVQLVMRDSVRRV